MGKSTDIRKSEEKKDVKKSYNKPMLTKFGKVESITHGGNVGIVGDVAAISV